MLVSAEFCMRPLKNSLNSEILPHTKSNSMRATVNCHKGGFLVGMLKYTQQLEPQGALIAHLSTMSTSVIS